MSEVLLYHWRAQGVKIWVYCFECEMHPVVKFELHLKLQASEPSCVTHALQPVTHTRMIGARHTIFTAYFHYQVCPALSLSSSPSSISSSLPLTCEAETCNGVIKHCLPVVSVQATPGGVSVGRIIS